MGKADQQKTQNAISAETTRSQKEQNDALSSTGDRGKELLGRSDAERGSVWGGFSDLSKGGIDPEAERRLLSGDYSAYGGPGAGGGSGGGGGGGGSAASGTPAKSYLDTFHELQGSTGGFDPTRLSNIEGGSASLYNTRGNYGDVNEQIGKLGGAEKNYDATNRSIGGLQDFAKTGGLNAGQLANINRDSLLDIEKTGGYSAGDIANERARGNAGIESTYSNLQDNLNRQKMVSGQLGPGWSSAGFKLARQGAQDTAAQTQKTEADIHDKVTGNRLAAGGKLGDLGLGTAGLQSQNTLTGYTNAGNLDIDKNKAIQDAWTNAGKLGLSREDQINAATQAAAGIDQNTQGLINQTRLGAASGESQDTLGRMSIGSNASAMSDALRAQNQRFLIGESDQNKATGLQGMLNTYGTAPAELIANQNLLRGYRQDASAQNQGLIQNRIDASRIPGIGSSIASGVGIAGKLAGIGSGIAGGFGGLFSGGGNGGAIDPNSPFGQWIGGGGGSDKGGAVK